jgi:hypothetical protein
MYVDSSRVVPLTVGDSRVVPLRVSDDEEARPRRPLRRPLPTVPRRPYDAGGSPTPPGGNDDPVLPRCPACGSIPLRCRQPGNCQFEDIKK